MVSGYIDAFLIACPAPDSGIEKFHQFVLDLLRWRALRDDAIVRLFASTRCYDVLVDTGAYPMWEPLKNVIATLNIRDIQARDVIDVAHGLLAKATIIEDELSVGDFLFDDTKLNLPWPSGIRDFRFDQHTKFLAVAMYFRRRSRQDDEKRHNLLSRGCGHTCVISLDMPVEDADGALRELYTWPVTAKASFGVTVDPDTIFNGLDVSDLLLDAIKTHDHSLMIAAIREALRRRGSSDNAWTVNASFGPSVWGLVAVGQSTLARAVLRACVETVLDENMAATHWIRRGAGAQEPQLVRTRDGARAWRRDIDHEYHLHYWATNLGPEFAVVVVHGDMSIPD